MAVILPFECHEGRSVSLDLLVQLVERDMTHVDEMILVRAHSHVDMIPKIAAHLITAGGKRLRPMLTLAAAQMCGYGGAFHIRLAAAVEFMHTATLLHDDVVDESNLRRGQETARLIWGNQASVLVGDYLLGQAFKMMVETGSLESLRVLSHAATVISEGEILQLAAQKDLATTEDDYLRVVCAKTAALFAAACAVGAVIAERPKQEQTALETFGHNLGVAFQLIDDALDYCGDEERLGKNRGNDFREGKMTLPVVLCYRRADRKDRAFWKRVLIDGEQKPEDFEAAITMLKAYDAISDTVIRARHYGQTALEALGLFPPSRHRRALEEALAFSIDRLS